MSWTPNLISDIKEEEKPPYDHGFSEEEVIRITEEKRQLEKKVEKGYTPTLEEFKNITIPYLRIHRTEEFIIAKAKEKKPKEPKAPKEPKEPKAPREKKEKVPKVKKLTKKEIAARQLKLQQLIMKKAAGVEYTDEDKEFLNMMGAEFE